MTLLLSVSPYASYIISCDLQAFSPKNGEEIPLSTLVNRIITSYAKRAKICHLQKLDITEYQLVELMGTLGITITDKHIERFKRFQQSKTVAVKKPFCRVKLRPVISDGANQTLDFIAKDDAYAAVRNVYKYNNEFSKPKFVAALLEEYAELPFDKREALFFCSYIDIINECIEYNRTHSRQPAFLNIKRIGQHGKGSVICPLELRSDEWSTHTYLLGAVYDKIRKYKFVTLRLSGIEQINETSRGSAFILDINVETLYNELFDLIEKNGVMFVSGGADEEPVTISLSTKGWKNYCSQIFLRPGFDSVKPDGKGRYIMKLSCSHRQIMNYFLKFGSDIEVLEPSELRKQFSDFYSKAKETYSE